MDAKGKLYTKWFNGCEKVCTKCNNGYYLKKKYRCVALPTNCNEADENGKCTKCSSGYSLNPYGNC